MEQTHTDLARSRWIILAGFDEASLQAFTQSLQAAESGMVVKSIPQSNSFLTQYGDLLIDGNEGVDSKNNSSSRTQNLDSRSITFIGIGEASDQFAKNFFALDREHPVQNVVLMSPSVGAEDLNKLTCPYLVVLGREDSHLDDLSQDRFDQAVYHHQMRYGDSTDDFTASSSDRSLMIEKNGRRELDPKVVTHVLNWLSEFRTKNGGVLSSDAQKLRD